jgi:hypothetical protein
MEDVVESITYKERARNRGLRKIMHFSVFLGRGLMDIRVDIDGQNENVDRCAFFGRINTRCSDSMTTIPHAGAWSSG